MGQKVNPHGIRVGVIKDWDSKWYAEDEFADFLVEDHEIREYLKKKLYSAGVSKIEIERASDRVKVIIYTAKPGVVIGKQGAYIEELKADVQKIIGVPAHISIEEVRRPELDAQLIADGITQQLEKRVMFRRAMKRAMQNAMRLGAQGIKIMSSGRLNGADIARCEWYREGRVPLHTLRADIDYAVAEANTTYGVIGVKVWVYKGDNFGQEEAVEAPREDRRGRRPGDRAAKPGPRRNNGRRNDKQQQARKPAAKDGE